MVRALTLVVSMGMASSAFAQIVYDGEIGVGADVIQEGVQVVIRVDQKMTFGEPWNMDRHGGSNYVLVTLSGDLSIGPDGVSFADIRFQPLDIHTPGNVGFSLSWADMTYTRDLAIDLNHYAKISLLSAGISAGIPLSDKARLL